jgi:hydroxymethylpyrimidine pyrophosphatase-like HAD family hydrolase
MVLATDFDGTLALNGHVNSETWEMLRQAKNAGLYVILVTGRTLESFITEGPFNELCEAVVAENGAIVYFPRRDIIAFPFGRLTPAVLQRLDGLEVPLERGMAIVATTVPHDEAILDVLREVGGGATVEYNRGAVMVLPLGATKGTGLAYALHELGYSPHNVAACGDAENDRSLFEVAEYAAAVANAPPGIKALADVVLPFANGEGVRSLITDLLSGSVPAYRSRPHRQLTVGRDVTGEPIHIDPFALLDSNLGVFGASSSGKSWLAGLVAEELLKQGYQICVIDPEGDYRSLGTGPHTMLLGGTPSPLPAVTDVINFLESGAVSIVLDLSMLTIADHHGYILELLRALQALRKRRGRPHWFLLDEAQYYLTPEDQALTEALLDMSRTGGLAIVSYRPSQLASAFLDSIQQWLLTRLGLPEDIQAVQPYIAKCSNCSDLVKELPELPLGQAYLCLGDVTQWLPPPEGIVRFQVGVRTVPHIRHLHKYLRAPLPAPKRFYFHDEGGGYLGRVAANLWEFRQALSDVPLNVLQFHLIRGDYERWIREVLRDDELSRRVRKLGGRDLYGEELRRALFETVANRYEELERLG